MPTDRRPRTELFADLAGDVVEIGSGNGRNVARHPAAGTAFVPVTVVPGAVEALPVPDASCHAAVLCLVLCSLPDRQAAPAGVVRVLRPGGCHTSTDAGGAIEAAGLEVTAARRLRLPHTRISPPVTPHVLGTARRNA